MDFTHDYARLLLKKRSILVSLGQKKVRWSEGIVVSLYYLLIVFIS